MKKEIKVSFSKTIQENNFEPAKFECSVSEVLEKDSDPKKVSRELAEFAVQQVRDSFARLLAKRDDKKINDVAKETAEIDTESFLEKVGE